MPGHFSLDVMFTSFVCNFSYGKRAQLKVTEGIQFPKKGIGVVVPFAQYVEAIKFSREFSNMFCRLFFSFQG